MRTSTLLSPGAALAAAAALTGCSEPCLTPEVALGGVVWTVHNTVVVQDPATVDPAYPGESSPANGEHAMSVTWNSVSLDSAVTVTIDGQEFPGQGTWDDAECGNFVMTWEGTYLSADGKAQHDFAASAILQTWEGHLEGTWHYVSAWTVGESAGRVDFDVQSVGAL